MPYQRVGKRVMGKQRFNNYKRGGKQLYKDVMYLKTLINSEPHTFTVAGSDNFTSTGAVHSLNRVPAGDGDHARTGTSMLPRYQQVNICIKKPATNDAGTITHECCRLILFRYWGESSSAAPSVAPSEILDSLSPLSFLNDDNTGSKGDRERRIEILKSKVFNLNTNNKSQQNYKFNIQVNGPNQQEKQHIKYRASTTEDPISGGFYLLLISDNSSGTLLSALDYNAKLVYYDN